MELLDLDKRTKALTALMQCVYALDSRDLPRSPLVEDAFSPRFSIEELLLNFKQRDAAKIYNIFVE